MILVRRNVVTEDWISTQFGTDDIKLQIANRMRMIDTIFTYKSEEILDFEVSARKELVRASERLNNSFFSFRLFKDSICNKRYWDRTEEGGFRLKKDASAYDAVRDILINSRMYGTECATAIVIVFYLALVEVFPKELFNRLFSDIYLMDWKYLDKDLGVRNYRGVKDAIPGDCLYFKNPDVNPDTPEWQGENVIKLMNDYYYGHGIGIKTAEGIIRDLNRNRIYNSERSAYLMDLIVKPDFKYLGEIKAGM
ncbi:MAG: protein-glutamine gamma-glutamyltransferase [Clostridiaceae bacterium]|nr:protein-glutamine gamma-glutamyltransferase [Clostridiaceae bacterium]